MGWNITPKNYGIRKEIATCGHIIPKKPEEKQPFQPPAVSLREPLFILQLMRALHFLLIFAAGLGHPLPAAGIEFFTGSWQQVLDEAKAGRKLIFVDAYAEWCGPCKAMARNSFPNEEVGKLYNQQFVNYQFDMEKGEGPAFAARYGVTAYPTLLFLNYKGEVVHRVLGYQSPAQLLAEGRRAADPSRNQANLELEMRAGEASPEEMRAYALNLAREQKPFAEAAAAYFETQAEGELLEAHNWEAIRLLSQRSDSREFRFLLEKQKAFVKRYGEAAVMGKIREVLRQEALAAALGQRPEAYQQLLALANESVKDQGETANRLKMTYAEASRDWDDYILKARTHFSTYAVTDAAELRHAAQLFALHASRPEDLEAALAWARQAVALRSTPESRATLARLLHRNGKKEEALREAYTARRLAELEDADLAPYERLIEELSR